MSIDHRRATTPSTPATSTTATGKTRSLAPDLARGFMLLLIGLAYAAVYLPASEVLLAPDTAGIGDEVTNLARTVFVHERSYTMFTALFGYGLVMIIRKLNRQGAGEQGTKKLLRRRGLLLLAFGFIHGALVYSGEILGTYGLLSVLLAGLVTGSDRALRRAIIVFLAIQGVFLMLVWTGVYAGGAGAELAGSGAQPGQNYLESVATRALEYPFSPVFITVMYPLIPVLLIGVWAGRRRLLEDAVTHRTLLVRTAWIGTGVSILGALPLGLANAGWLALDLLPTGLAVAVHNLTGIAGGLGYLAIFALIGHRLQGERAAVADALAATGQRSLSAYLLMSALIAVTMAPWGFDAGASVSVIGAVGVGLACWAVAAAWCAVLARGNMAGPADTLLRRWLYR